MTINAEMFLNTKSREDVVQEVVEFKRHNPAAAVYLNSHTLQDVGLWGECEYLKSLDHHPSALYGLKVVACEDMVDHVWVFPKDRFVIYEPKDEGWCRRLGIGHEEVRPQSKVIVVCGVMYAHPAVIKELEKVYGAKVEDEKFRRDAGPAPWTLWAQQERASQRLTKVLEDKAWEDILTMEPNWDSISTNPSTTASITFDLLKQSMNRMKAVMTSTV